MTLNNETKNVKKNPAFLSRFLYIYYLIKSSVSFYV